MSRNWIRTCSLVVNGQNASENLGNLRVVFKIEANSAQSPNMARFRVYNCSPNTAQALFQQEFSQVQFFAGYQDNSGLVYAGDLKQAIIGHETALDSYVDLFCADGDRAYNTKHVNTTLSSGYTPQDKFNTALQAMGLTVGTINVDLSQPQYPRGSPIFAMARDVIREIATSKGALWSIQDSATVNMIDGTKPIQASTFTMNASTGMIGWPRQTGDGIIVSSLLNPALRPDTLIHLDNASIIGAERDNNPLTEGGSQQNFNLDNTGLLAADGIYRILYLERSGDTRGNDWTDTSTCIANGTGSPNQHQVDSGYVTQ